MLIVGLGLNRRLTLRPIAGNFPSKAAVIAFIVLDVSTVLDIFCLYYLGGKANGK